MFKLLCLSIIVTAFCYVNSNAQIIKTPTKTTYGVKTIGYPDVSINYSSDIETSEIYTSDEWRYYKVDTPPGKLKISPFKHEPHLALPYINKYFHGTIIKDSIVNVYRFGVPISPAGITFKGTYQASAGIEYGFQHQDYNYSTQTYTVLYSVNVVWMPVNTAQTIKSVKDIETFGLLVGFKNNLIQIGPFCNPNAVDPKDRFGVWGVIAINLN